MIAAPQNFKYVPDKGCLRWDPVIGAIEYEIMYQNSANGQWEQIYRGGNNSCPFNKPPGMYAFKGKSHHISGWGFYGETEIIYKIFEKFQKAKKEKFYY